MVSPSARRTAARYLKEEKDFSEKRACSLVKLSRSGYRYEPRKKPDEDRLRQEIKALSNRHKRFGCPRIFALLRRKGIKVNKKRVHRIWKDEGLSLPVKRPRRRRFGPPVDVYQKAEYPDHVWSYDFLEDRTERGGRLRCLVIVDEYTRECLSIHVAPSIRSEQVIEELEWLFLTRGVPEHIRSDNGSEFVANAVQKWISDNGSFTIFITPGSPWKNPYVESFNGKFRDECLNREIFKNGKEARVIIEVWREDYNKRRPHSSLGNQTPSEFAGSSSPPVFAPLKQAEKSYVI